MKIKKLLLSITLTLSTFFSQSIVCSQEPNNGYMALIATAIGVVASATTILTNYQTYTHNSETHDVTTKKTLLEINNGYLKAIKESDEALLNNITTQKNIDNSTKTETAKNLETIKGLNSFLREGKGANECFNPEKHKYSSSPTDTDKKQEQDSTTDKKQTPGKIKQAATFIAAAAYGMTDKIADALPINHIASTEYFKDTALNTYKSEISHAAAIGLMAGAAAIIYKSYKWYYDEERLLACEAIAELEEQKQQIEIQFEREIAKTTVSTEEKSKLINAYNNFMEDLQEEIEKQQKLAGYDLMKKAAIGSAVILGGIAILPALMHYYLPKSPDDQSLNPNKNTPNISTTPTVAPNTSAAPTNASAKPSDTTQAQQINSTDNNSNHADTIIDNKTEQSKNTTSLDDSKINAPQIEQSNNNDLVAKYNKLTRCERWLPKLVHDKLIFNGWTRIFKETTPEERASIDQICNAHALHELEKAKKYFEENREKQKWQNAVKKNSDLPQVKQINSTYNNSNHADTIIDNKTKQSESTTPLDDSKINAPQIEQSNNNDPRVEKYNELTRCQSILPAWLHDWWFSETTPEERARIDQTCNENAQYEQEQRIKKEQHNHHASEQCTISCPQW